MRCEPSYASLPYRYVARKYLLGGSSPSRHFLHDFINLNLNPKTGHIIEWTRHTNIPYIREWKKSKTLSMYFRTEHIFTF